MFFIYATQVCEPLGTGTVASEAAIKTHLYYRSKDHRRITKASILRRHLVPNNTLINILKSMDSSKDQLVLIDYTLIVLNTPNPLPPVAMTTPGICGCQ